MTDVTGTPPGAPGPGWMGPNWLLAMLPNLDQGPLYNQYNQNLSVYHPSNANVVSYTVPIFLCPSDPYATPQNLCNTFGNLMARGNIGMSGYGRVGIGNWNTISADQKGLMGENSYAGIRDVVDGTSTTVASWELRAGPAAGDPRGVWASGRVGGGLIVNCLNPSATQGRWTGDCFGINEGDIPGHCCGDDVWSNGYDENQGITAGMGGWNGADGQAGPKSKHVGGCHALFCDGSVKFISANLEGGVMLGIMTIGGAEMIGTAF